MKTNTTYVWSIVIALIIGSMVGYYAAPSSPTTGGAGMQNGTSTATTQHTQSPDKQIALYGSMRKLWADHVIWTREYMIAVLNGSPSATADAARLMKNQEDIGNTIGVYYGAEAGTQLTTLLKQHIAIAVELIAAAKINDKTKLNEASARWQENADQIATFLSQANPSWTKAAALDLMTMHLKTTSDELTALSSKEYGKGITAFDAVFDHMMDVSDVLSGGIITQFPDKF